MVYAKLTDDEAGVLAASIRCSELVEVVVVGTQCGEEGSFALLKAIEESETVEAAYIDCDSAAVLGKVREAVGRLLGARRSQLALFFGAICSDVDGVQAAVEAGASLERKCCSRTPLYISSRMGHVKVVEFLASKGADINARNLYGSTPLYLASEHGHVKVAEFLVENKADLDAAKQDGTTALDVASANKHHQVVEILLRGGARRLRDGDVIDVALNQGGERLAVVKRWLESVRAPDEKFKIAMGHRGRTGIWALIAGPGPLHDLHEGLRWLRMAVLEDHSAAKVEYAKLSEEAVDALELGREIARGAYGEVLEGRLWGQRVALKRPNGGGDPEKDLLNEIKRLGALLAHENVVQYYCGGKKGGRVVLVMEYVDGGDARGVLSEEPSRREVAVAIACGMAHLHRNIVAHLDLKPENVLVGNDGSVKVTDFGMAQQIERRKDGSVSVKSLELDRGTYEYMDPRIFTTKDQRVIPDRADVYAFGIMLFELVTGQRARYSEWDGVRVVDVDLWDNPMQIIPIFRDIHEHKYRPRIPPEVGENLAILIRECWHSDSSQRPRFADIISRLEEC